MCLFRVFFCIIHQSFVGKKIGNFITRLREEIHEIRLSVAGKNEFFCHTRRGGGISSVCRRMKLQKSQTGRRKGSQNSTEKGALNKPVQHMFFKTMQDSPFY